MVANILSNLSFNYLLVWLCFKRLTGLKEMVLEVAVMVDQMLPNGMVVAQADPVPEKIT